MEDDPICQKICEDIDFILDGKIKIDNQIKNKIIDIISYGVTYYSHKLINGELGYVGKSIFGHIQRKNIRQEYMKYARNYLNKKSEIINRKCMNG